MSQIEMIGQAGFNLTVDVRNPLANYASLATGLSVTEVTPTVYRAALGSLSGLVHCLFKSGAIKFAAGYANLDEPGGNGYSEVFDTLAEATAAGGGDVAAGISEINSKIQTGVVNVVSPVNADGSMNTLVIGDDYVAAHNRALDFFVDPISGVSVGDCTCTFGGEANHKGSWLVSGAVSAVTVDTVPKWRMRFELAGDDTRDCKPGCYAFGATLLPPSKRATKITGNVDLIASHTIE